MHHVGGIAAEFLLAVVGKADGVEMLLGLLEIVGDALLGKKITRPADACVIDLELSGTETSVITLSNSKGEKVVMTLDVHAHTFAMDRTAAGDCSFSQDFAAVTVSPLFVAREQYNVRLFIDHCSIEAFDANGYWAMTNLVFPTKPYNQIKVQGGKATIYDVNI